MARKLTYDFVKSEFKNRGYILIDEEYKNSGFPMRYICPKHSDKETFINYDNLKAGKGCKYCAFEKNANRTRLKFDVVKQEIESDNYTLLSKKYENAHNKLVIRCLNKHTYESSFSQWRAGTRCPYCSRNRIDIENFKNEIENKGFKWVDGDYHNTNSELKLRCDKGHSFTTNRNYLRVSIRCPICTKDNVASKRRMSVKTIYKTVKNKGYKFLCWKELYKNNTSKFILKCKNGHLWETNWANFNKGGCKKCGDIKIGNAHRFKVDDVIQEVEEIGYSALFTEYKNSSEKLLIKCDNGHLFKMARKHFAHGIKCPKCNISKGEDEINNILNKYNILIIRQKYFNKCINKKKLPFDFYINNNLLLEYDGYQHFNSIDYYGGIEGYGHRVNNDKIKNQYCIDNNIPLIRIPYWEQKNIHYILDNVLHYFNIKQLDDPSTYNKEIVERYLVDKNWNHDTYISWQHKENRYWLDKLVHNV